jgi:putative PEP-CTERM system TPR-repeat lipoprotein
MCRQLLALIIFFLWPLILQASDAEEFLRDARSYFNKEEYGAAVIQLKNALLVDPDNRESRLLLGQAYLKLEDGLSAEKELMRARELGVSREKVLIPLGRAWLMIGQSQKLVQNLTIEASDPLGLKVEILVLQGNAYLAMQRFATAEEQYAKALELQPDAAEALLGNAQIAFEGQDLVAANTLVDRVVSIDPEIAQAWVIKGELLRMDGKLQEADTAFQRALDVAPNNIRARMGKTTTLIALGRPEDAIIEIDQLQKRYQDLYLGHYLRGLAYFEQQQLIPAQEAVQLALKQEPSYIPSHLLAGIISYKQGNLNQAEHHLLTYWNGDKDNTQATKLLASTLLKPLHCSAVPT